MGEKKEKNAKISPSKAEIKQTIKLSSRTSEAPPKRLKGAINEAN